MLTRLANLGIRAPRRVLIAAGFLLVLAVIFGAPVAAHLSGGGFRDPGSASSKADDLLQSKFNAGDANLILELSTPAGSDSAAARTEGRSIVQALQHEKYASQVVSYWTVPRREAVGLRSADGKSALVVARVEGNDNTAPIRAADMTKSLVGTHDGVTVTAGGIMSTYKQVNDKIAADLKLSEMIAIPLTIVALTWVFGSFVAALLPLAVGLSSIIGTMAILRGLSMATDVSIYALNMTTALGLALAIDYSLFIVSRYREEVRNGSAPEDAVRRTMQTAGRTVLFSALTVGLALAALMVFPVYFLRSFAYAGIAVVGLATLAALILLPAMLTILGPRVDALDLRVFVRNVLRRPTPAPRTVEQGFWYRFATLVMRRALPVGLLVTAVLVALGLPFLHASFGYPDDRVLPQSAPAHQVGDSLRSQFSSNAASTITVVARDISGAPGEVAAYAAALSKVPNVTSVGSSAGTFAAGREVAPASGAPMISGKTTYFSVATNTDAQGESGKQALAAVQDIRAPWGIQFTGQTAINNDSLQALAAAMPYAIGLIALATFIVLFLFTGSIVLPIKALVLNTLSLSATFGAMVWVFQEGHLGWLFPELTTTGYLVPTMPPLMFCLAFGLSMDYEVFLLSRIREAWLESPQTAADNEHAVAVGLGRTGRIVTAAALLMSIVFAAIAGSSVSFMMLFGAGLTLAVIMDATIVRGILVPAFMKLAGKWNWWAPRPLAKLHARFGLNEGPSPVQPAVHREPIGVA
ncbi:MAG: MMPL family transporter [Pseudonocardiales bacterium]